jgi:hypothetical protein
MKQAIAGVAPADLEEVTMMVVWPSIAATMPGRLLGNLYAIKAPDIYFFRIGNLFALLAIPVSLALYFLRLLPSVMGLPVHGVTYRLTNRRIIEERSEINIGPVSFLFRLFVGVKTIAMGLILAVIFATFMFEWALPNTTLEYAAAGLCLLIVVAGIIPLVAEVPGPVFRFGVEGRSVALDRFDQVVIDVRPGQGWYKAGDLIFTGDGVETFRLDGVSRPEAFRATCVKAQMGFVGVQKALAQAALNA